MTVPQQDKPPVFSHVPRPPREIRIALTVATVLGVATAIKVMLAMRPPRSVHSSDLMILEACLGSIIVFSALIIAARERVEITVDGRSLTVRKKREQARFTYEQLLSVSVATRLGLGYRQASGVVSAMTEDGRRLNVWAMQDGLISGDTARALVLEFIDGSKPFLIMCDRREELLHALAALVARRRAEGLADYANRPLTEHGAREWERIGFDGRKKVQWPFVLFACLGTGLVTEAILFVTTGLSTGWLAYILVGGADFAGGYGLGRMLTRSRRENGAALGVALIFWQLLWLAGKDSEQAAIVLFASLIAIPAAVLGAAVSGRMSKEDPQAY